MFPDVADDLATHVLYALKFIKLILRRNQPKRSCSSQCWTEQELEQLVVPIWCLNMV